MAPIYGMILSALLLLVGLATSAAAVLTDVFFFVVFRIPLEREVDGFV